MGEGSGWKVTVFSCLVDVEPGSRFRLWEKGQGCIPFPFFLMDERLIL